MSERLVSKQAAAARTPKKRRNARGQAAMKRSVPGPRPVKSSVGKAAPRSIAIQDAEAQQELRQLLEHVAALEGFSIARFRKRYEVSRVRLSLAAQLPYHTILRWEKSISVPRLSSFRAFAEALLSG